MGREWTKNVGTPYNVRYTSVVGVYSVRCVVVMKDTVNPQPTSGTADRSIATSQNYVLIRKDSLSAKKACAHRTKRTIPGVPNFGAWNT